MKLKKYDIAITKPWSKEIYDHNDEVLREVVDSIEKKWLVAYHDSENKYYIGSPRSCSPEFPDAEWSYEANAIMKDIQEAVLVTSYGSGFTMHSVHNDVLQELEVMAYWRAKEVAEDLSLLLSKEFIGLG